MVVANEPQFAVSVEHKSLVHPLESFTNKKPPLMQNNK
jgi:hypothetical protein